MSHPRRMTLGAYIDKFIEEHAIAKSDDQIILDVTSEEAEELGLFFIRGLCGWMQGLKHVRCLRQLTQTVEVTGDDELIDEDEEEETDKTFVN